MGKKQSGGQPQNNNGLPGANNNDPGDDDPADDAMLIGTSDSAPLGLDDSPSPPDVAETAAKDVDGVPYCRVHHCRMTQYSGGAKDNPKAYYKCKAPDCKETARIIKTDKPQIVPDRLLGCPRCSNGDELVVCERDPRCSTAACVILTCPKCKWKSTAMAVPQLAAAHFARGGRSSLPPVEEIGAR